MQVNIKKKYQIKTKKTNVEHLKFHRILLFLVFMYNNKHRGLCVVASQIMYNYQRQLKPNGVKEMKDKKGKSAQFSQSASPICPEIHFRLSWTWWAEK